MKTSLAMLIAGLVAAGAWIALEPGMRAQPDTKSPAAATAEPSSAARAIDAKRTPDPAPGSGQRID
jgi:hypothetical protein